MPHFVFSKEVKEHKKNNLPVLALESTIIAHGMPYPESYNFAKKIEKSCREKGVAPATIAVLHGQIHIGLNNTNLKKVCRSKKILKLPKEKQKNGSSFGDKRKWRNTKKRFFC